MIFQKTKLNLGYQSNARCFALNSYIHEFLSELSTCILDSPHKSTGHPWRELKRTCLPEGFSDPLIYSHSVQYVTWLYCSFYVSHVSHVPACLYVAKPGFKLEPYVVHTTLPAWQTERKRYVLLWNCGGNVEILHKQKKKNKENTHHFGISSLCQFYNILRHLNVLNKPTRVYIFDI